MLHYADSALRFDEIALPWRVNDERIVLVPTMGNLHEGHLSLCTEAARIGDRVVATIFVNPTQFGENEDFDSYPRTLDADVEALRATECVDAVFVPQVAEVYPHGIDAAARLVMPPLSRELCGASRPGHFDGVAGVVLRLLNLTVPDVLILGEKDFQQLVLLRWLVEDLRLRPEVVGLPTQRAADGLAMSSRNRYLSEAERAQAPELHRQLAAVADAIRRGEHDYGSLQARASKLLDDDGFRTDYIEIRKANDLQVPDADDAKDLIVLGAAWLGKARLIDNVRV
jgi:pantoate--beta-alanine ligase